MADVKRVIVDAGHGDEGSGAMYDGRREEDDTLRLALAIGQMLENNRVDVVYIRTMGIYDTPLEKAQIVNQPGADYSMSIHRGAFPVPEGASGAMTLVYQSISVSAMLVDNVQRSLVEAGLRDLEVQECPGLIVPRKTQMPAALVGAEFIDNPGDNRFLDENFDAIAQAITDGVLETVRQQEAKWSEYYQAQMGASRTRMPAGRLVDKLQASGLPTFLAYDDGLYKARVGVLLNTDYVMQIERSLRNMGYLTVLVRKRVIY